MFDNSPGAALQFGIVKGDESLDERFARTSMLLGQNAMDTLAGKSVFVCGIGGVGSYICEALARGGVGAITVMDSDVVEKSNINRQLVALESTVGMSKAEVMARRIKDINPNCAVTPIKDFYDRTKEEQIFSAHFDYVADAIDSVGAKLDLICAAKERGIPAISAMGTGNKLDPSLFRIADINQTSVCPLARVVRRELRLRGIERHKVLFSTETPVKAASHGEGRTPPASCSFTPPVAGLLIAREIILDLLK